MTEHRSPVSRICTQCHRDILGGSSYYVDASGELVRRLCRGCYRMEPADARKLPTASRP